MATNRIFKTMWMSSLIILLVLACAPIAGRAPEPPIIYDPMPAPSAPELQRFITAEFAGVTSGGGWSYSVVQFARRAAWFGLDPILCRPIRFAQLNAEAVTDRSAYETVVYKSKSYSRMITLASDVLEVTAIDEQGENWGRKYHVLLVNQRPWDCYFARYCHLDSAGVRGTLEVRTLDLVKR